MSFQELGISPEVLQALEEMGFEQPTPIQRKVIPLQMKGGDVIGQAQTGTGKTAAFGIPLVEQLKPRSQEEGRYSCDALILTPTRELASQVAEELQKIGKHRIIKTLAIYGGTPIEPQIRALRRRPHLVVGTPGRTLDHLSRRTLNLSGVRFFVLDEADEMLDMGFIEDVFKILEHLPQSRQMLMFSATMPPEIRRIAAQHMNSPELVSVSKSEIVVSKIQQFFYHIEENERFEGLCRILDVHQPEMALIFCQTKREVDEVHQKLLERGYDTEALHGDFNQNQREQVMQKFRNHDLDVLIATDLAARGIDVSNVSIVVNFNIPQNPETYVHRIGRTGRAGRSGIAATLMTEEEFKPFLAIQRITKSHFKRQAIPLLEEIRDIRKGKLEKRVTDYLSKEECVEFVDLAASILEKASAIEVLASTLKLAYDLSSPPLKVDRQHELNSENTGAERGMVRFFLNAGRNNQLNVGDLVRSITRNTSIPGEEIGKILLQDEFSFIEVPENWAEHLLETLPSMIIRDTEIIIKPARSRSKLARFKDSKKHVKRSRYSEATLPSQRRA